MSSHRFELHVVRFSRVAQAVDLVASYACGWTGHRLERWYMRISNWAWRKSERLFSQEIDRATAYRIDPVFVKRVEEDYPYVPIV